ncbi:hypothetical protein MMC06_004675 [Schaereria dolodes]|nr:hypothetical protein [Schaereria dolodes]
MPPTSIGTVRERQRERDTRNALVATIPYYITDNYYHVPGYAGTKANMMALERIRDLEQTITTLIGRVENLRASLREQSIATDGSVIEEEDETEQEEEEDSVMDETMSDTTVGPQDEAGEPNAQEEAATNIEEPAGNKPVEEMSTEEKDKAITALRVRVAMLTKANADASTILAAVN